MSRLLKIMYGSTLVLGLDQTEDAYNLDGKYRDHLDYESGLLSVEVLVSDAIRADFLAAEATLAAEVEKPDQDLLVTLDGTTRIDARPSTNSGFNTRGELRKIAGKDSSANSARYEVTFTWGRPASLTGRAGRRDSSVDVQQDPGERRTITVEGTYTALANNAARAQFESAFTAYANTVLADIDSSAVFELLGRTRARADDQNKLLVFTRVYRELLYDQQVGVRDSTLLEGQELQIERAELDSGSTDEFDAAPLLRLAVTYSVFVKASGSTNLGATWEGVCLPHILESVYKYTSGPILVSELRPRFDPDNNRITATLVVEADAGGSFLFASAEWIERTDLGAVLRPVWSGDEYARDVYQGMASQVRTVRFLTVGFAGTKLGGYEPLPAAHTAPTFPQFLLVRRSRRQRRRVRGVEGFSDPLLFATTTYTYVRAHAVSQHERPTTGGDSEGIGSTDHRR